MIYSSHRLRAREKQVVRKLSVTALILTGSIIFAVYLGLPLMAKLAVGMSLLKGEDKKISESSKLPVFAPVIEELPAATNSASIVISVLSEKDKTIILSVNGEIIKEDKTDDEGKFKFRGITLKPGENNISVTAKENDQESQPAKVSIIYKNEPPILEINEPEEGKTVYNNPNVTIKGLTDSDTRININDRFVIVGKSGGFNYPAALKEGENIFKIKALDDAGNVTEKEFKINYSP